VIKATSAGPALSWTTPAATPSVSAFEVTVGKAGVLDRQVTVAASSGNSLSLNNLATAQYTACVKPLNSVGQASAASVSMMYPNPKDSATWYTVIKTPNCLTVDNRLTQATVGGLAGTTQVLSAGLRKVAFSWAATTPVPSDLPITRYRVSQTITYPTGPVRKSTLDVGSLSTSLTTIPGSTVCMDVAAATAMGQLGPRSSQACIVAR
jgi:hypothetical protein